MNMRKFIRSRVTRKEYEMSVDAMLTPCDINVRELKPMSHNSFAFWNEVQHLIWICGAEARGEDKHGIEYVAHTILNRWKLQYGYFGLSIREVIHKCSKSGCYQFSAANPKDSNFDWLDKEPQSVFYKVAKAVLPVYCNQKVCPNRRMLYYHASSLEPPSFFNNKLKFMEKVGNHIFYIDKNIPDSHIII